MEVSLRRTLQQHSASAPPPPAAPEGSSPAQDGVAEAEESKRRGQTGRGVDLRAPAAPPSHAVAHGHGSFLHAESGGPCGQSAVRSIGTGSPCGPCAPLGGAAHPCACRNVARSAHTGAASPWLQPWRFCRHGHAGAQAAGWCWDMTADTLGR